MFKRIMVIVCALVLCCCLCACGEKQNPIVTIELEDGRKIVVELYPKYAPNTVANFVTLVQNGYYDGTVFYRAVPEFVIQGGEQPDGSIESVGYTIKGEFSANGYTSNYARHVTGAISMARADDYDSASTQFFICVTDKYSTNNLNGNYAAFGEVIEGMDVVTDIANQAATQERLDEPVVIARMTVETFGERYSVKKIKTKE